MNFTLTEVVICLAIIAVGMVGIMALFPIGLKATMDAVGDNYSSSMAEQFASLVQKQCDTYDGNGEYLNPTDDLNLNGIPDYDGWGEWIGVRTGYYDDPNIISISTNPPLADNLDIGKVEKNYSAMFFGDSDGDGKDDAGIYYDKDSVGDNNGVFYVEARTKEILDWNGVMYVWLEPVRYDSTGNGVADSDMSYDFAVRLCMEVSWPFEKPYKQRRKRLYVKEFFNQIER